MDYKNMPNLLLESIAYLGRKASGNTWDSIEQKMKKRNFKNNTSFQSTFIKLNELTNNINKNISISDDILHKLFDNFEGFPFNTIGSNSIAFLLFYQVLEDFNGNFDELIEYMKSFSNDRIAYNIAEALDISDEYKDISSMNDREFMDGVLSLSIPAESKVAILDTYKNYHKYLDDVAKCLSPIINMLNSEKDTLLDIISNFNSEVTKIGCSTFFKQISHLKPIDGMCYNMRPFIFGMDTNITSNLNINTINIYCGILRKELLDMLNNQVSYIDDIYEAYNILGDRTRFDILCYLRKNSAYGQELSNHFKLSRNTIHHHMNKLLNYGFVTCTTDGNRVYYSLNKETFENLISNQKELFCN